MAKVDSEQVKTREQVRVCSGFTDSTEEEEETRKSCRWGRLTSTWVEELNRETSHTPNLMGTRRPLVCERGSQKILDQLTKTKPKLRTEFLMHCCPGPSSPPLPRFNELTKKLPIFTSVRGHTTQVLPLLCLTNTNTGQIKARTSVSHPNFDKLWGHLILPVTVYTKHGSADFPDDSNLFSS